MTSLSLLSLLLSIYAVVTGLFLISENRRPQSTLAWMLAFLFAPGIGVVIYFFFGRHRKAFAKRSRLLRQSFDHRVVPVLSALQVRQGAAVRRLEPQGPLHRKLVRLVTQNALSSLTTRNQVEILQNASSFYPSLLKDIEEAQHSIHLQFFIWRVDEFTTQLKNLLIAKAKEGVKVRLLYDPIGSFFSMSRHYVAKLRAGGIQMAPTSPIYQLHTISYRNHRKITVIDGRIGYLGGMNMGQEHLDGGRGYAGWRDTQIRLEGEAVTVLQTVFMIDWYNATRESVFSKDYFPTPSLPQTTPDLPVQILTSGPDSRWEAIRQQYAQMITAARHHVYIQTPYFILDTSIAEALSIAAMSGIDVRVMMGAPGLRDRVPGWAANTFMADVARAGVKVFLYEKGYLHTKTIAVDSEICSIGSANLDIRSFSINYELNAVLYNAALTRELEAAFASDLDHCRHFDPAAYEARPLLLRFRDSTARLFSPLL